MTIHQNAREIYDYFADTRRLGPIGACGMVAQADAESGFNTHACGDGGEAYGLWQMHMDRIRPIREAIGIDIAAFPDVLEQCAAAWHELETTESFARREICAARTPYEAGYAACRYYERPASQAEWDKRGWIADRWARVFGQRT